MSSKMSLEAVPSYWPSEMGETLAGDGAVGNEDEGGLDSWVRPGLRGLDGYASASSTFVMILVHS